MTATIMIVDDNASTRRMVRVALQSAGYTVVEAPDGATAKLLMVSERPRLVLQDLVLPDTDGFTLVGELRKLGAPDVAILAFSGFVAKLDEARISAVGFDHIIPKPIAPSALVPLIEAHLPPPSVATNERFGEGRKVVIVDDDPLQLKLASFRLSRLGFEIETAGDGAAALAAIEIHGSVLKLDASQAGRIVFVTGGAFTESARTFFETTNNPRIEKPFDLKTLRHLVNELIR